VVEIPDIQPTQIAGASLGGTPQTLADNERDHIRRVLELSGGRIDGPRGTARILGLNASTLRSRMEKLGLL
jgi:transcriptional regulator with GAF, ATPase, and Fis domain